MYKNKFVDDNNYAISKIRLFAIQGKSKLFVKSYLIDKLAIIIHKNYDLNTLYADVSESGQAIEIRKVFYEATPAIHRYFDPYAGTGAGSYNMLDSILLFLLQNQPKNKLLL